MDSIFQQYILYQTSHGWVDWGDIPLRTLEVLQQGHSPFRQNYDVIFLDEAQDFTPAWIKVVKEVLKPNGSLFICDDPTQSIARYYSWRQKGIEVTGRTRILRVPFRNIYEISKAAYSLIEADPILSKEEEITKPDMKSDELSYGHMPDLLRFSDRNKQREYIDESVRQLIEERIDPGQIAILCHDPDVVDEWKTLLSAKGIYVAHFNKMKGLEFRAVFLPYMESCAKGLFTELGECQGLCVTRIPG